MADGKINKSQSIIDFAIALIAIALLALGVVRIWVWFNVNYAKRQVDYQQGRLMAGGQDRPKQTSDYNKPVGIGANEACRDCGFQPLDLTEDWVFKGKASGTVGGGVVPFIEASGLDCASQVKLLVDAYTEQIVSICGSDEDCDSCLSDCDSGINTTGTGSGGGGPRRSMGGLRAPSDIRNDASATGTGSSGGGDCGQACSLRKTAQTMHETAQDLKRGIKGLLGGKKASKKLEDAKGQIVKQAEKLEKAAKDVSQKLKALPGCCNKTTRELQNKCISQLQEEINNLWSNLSSDLVPPEEETTPACPAGQAYGCLNQSTMAGCEEGSAGCVCKCWPKTVPGCSYNASAGTWTCPPGTCDGTAEGNKCNTAAGYKAYTLANGGCACLRLDFRLHF